MAGERSQRDEASEPRTAGAGARVVRSFLDAFERRDLDAARALLAEGCSMTFPGPASFSRLEDAIQSRQRIYSFARKSYEGFDEALGDGGASVVYCYGTLSGEWLDGTPFAGIRFVDRFTVSAGKISDQQVWNDLALAMIDRRTAQA